jgi:hypothetical protein
MPRQYDQIETIAGSELRARLIAAGAIRPKVRPFLLPTATPATLLLDDAGRAAAERHIAAGAGRVIEHPVMGLEGFMSSSRPRVVRRGRR